MTKKKDLDYINMASTGPRYYRGDGERIGVCAPSRNSSGELVSPATSIPTSCHACTTAALTEAPYIWLALSAVRLAKSWNWAAAESLESSSVRYQTLPATSHELPPIAGNDAARERVPVFFNPGAPRSSRQTHVRPRPTVDVARCGDLNRVCIRRRS